MFVVSIERPTRISQPLSARVIKSEIRFIILWVRRIKRLGEENDGFIKVGKKVKVISCNASWLNLTALQKPFSPRRSQRTRRKTKEFKYPC